jgi:hypothetical protein
MHVLQFRGREPVFAALEGFDLVGEFELLEEDEDTLGAGRFEPVGFS